MIGIIVWAILIIFIAECTCPGLIWVILGSMAVYGVLYFAFWAIVDKIKLAHGKSKRYKSDDEQMQPPTREDAIRAWEKKWGRPHPSRKFNKR